MKDDAARKREKRKEKYVSFLGRLGCLFFSHLGVGIVASADFAHLVLGF